MTPEQREARKKSAESGNIRWIKDNCLRDKDSKDDYVFISYKSDDFEKVLDDILYKTCRKYGLKVYFDTAFDEKSDSWINQYYDNMSSSHCKAFIAFLTNVYFSSYACLLEMMSSRCNKIGESLHFIPINLESITDYKSDDNTGLGTYRFSDGKINLHAENELEKFNEKFEDLLEDRPELKKIYKGYKHKELYYEKTDKEPAKGELYLNVAQCRKLMAMVIPKENENDGSNKNFEDIIHDKLIKKGFDKVFIKDWKNQSNEDPGKVTVNKNNTESEEVTQTVKPTSETVTQAETESYTDKVEVSKVLEKSSQSTMRNSNAIINETTTLAEFEKLCESVDFCQKLRTARKQKHGAGQIFDFLVASLLGGCDKKIPDDKNTSVRKGAFNYCVYAISEVVDLENVKLGASQYTWMSNARKAMRKEDMPDNFFNDKGKVKSGTLGEYSTIFEQLSSDMTIGEVLDKYKAKERGFHTKNNEGIFEAWELIKNIDVKEGKKGLEELM
ncbi:MAG: toll/interleukin-1 receptor domain-containing protein [Catonella sp.]|uniref:toll/interleukin-1 receptor domain-containing protein n=1 Tax=Catonella sp. TaxID=2382125 RepID=UPI003F9F9BD7